MKILMLVGQFHPNLTEWVEAFYEYGHTVEVIAPKIGVNEDYRRLRPRVVPDDIDRPNAERIAEEIGADLVIIRHAKIGYRKILKAARRRGARGLFYDQDHYLRPLTLRTAFRDVQRAVKRLVLGLPLRGITPSKGISGCPRLWVDWVKVPMPVAGWVHGREYFSGGVPTVLLIGKLAHPKKRHLWVLRALEEIGSPYRLLVAGAGDDSNLVPEKRSSDYYNEVCEAFRNAGKEGSSVEILEDYSHEHISELYAQADIFVLPSTKEHFAISPIEAMACGCAVVSTNNNGSAGYITHGKNGLLFDVESYSGFKEALRGLVKSPDRVRTLGHNAAEKMASEHTPEQFIRQVMRAARISYHPESMGRG